MVKGFGLPDLASTVQGFIYAMRRGPLYAPKNLSQAKRPTLSIFQRGKNQMDVVRHYHHAMSVQFFTMLMQAVTENQASDGIRKQPTPMSEKCNKKGLVFFLKMGQFPPVFPFGGSGVWQLSRLRAGAVCLGPPRTSYVRIHGCMTVNIVGTAALGCPTV
jgi:hypothetical protein